MGGFALVAGDGQSRKVETEMPGSAKCDSHARSSFPSSGLIQLPHTVGIGVQSESEYTGNMSRIGQILPR